MSSFLQNYQRQPKLFIDLPSKGTWYDESIIEGEQYVQIPVFGMNAMDEIMFKTPDALYSGDATANVIKSCIPTILDPWKLVGFDIDYVLIAIRIATYNDSMPVNSSCPMCSHLNESVLSLTKMIQNYENYKIENTFSIDDLTFNIRPISYKQMTDFSTENYSYERQLYQSAQSDELTEQQKDKITKEIFQKTNDLNLRVAISYISSVSNSTDSETNLNAITEFVVNNDAKFYSMLQTTIFDLTNQWKVPKITIKCGGVSEEGKECNHEYNSKVELDYSNFFGLKFLHSRNLIS